MLKRRSVAAVIIFSIITFGIYALYWYWVTMHALDQEGGASNMSPGIQFLLLFLYVGIIIFALNADANLNSIKSKRELPVADNKAVYIILAIFIPVVMVGLVQNEINQLAGQAVNYMKQ